MNYYFTFQQHKKLLFSIIYARTFLYKNLLFYITNILLTFLKLQKTLLRFLNFLNFILFKLKKNNLL